MENQKTGPHFTKAVEALKDLPVAKVVDDVVQSVKSGKVTVLTAETGSGKTLLASSKLADASDDQVVVLVPRRFLAINAAEAIAELSGAQVGKEVGYAIGRQSGDRSKFSPQTKLVFATYGYALSSGLLDTAKTIVCDEVHEAGIDTSLARALIYKRLQTDKSLRVLEMSATLNAPKQAAYWEGAAQSAIYHAEGKAFPCDSRHVTNKSITHTVRDLIKFEGRNGVAVFRPGVNEVKKTAEELNMLFRDSGMKNVEVAIIYGDMNMEERAEAVKPPQPGNVKVLIGTNVIESGVNIKWLDTGVSDGLTKIPYYRESGAEALVTEELPQWRIIQQEGRVKRFSPGIFVLNSKLGMESRRQESSPEISRISLTGLVLHAANYGINPLELHYDAPVDKKGLLRAKQDLMRLELLNEDWSLTEKGQYVTTLPLGAEAGAMMWSAPQEIRSDIIELAAIVEMRGLRADFRISHGQDENSDMLDALKIFKKLGYDATEETCEKFNVSWKQYNDVKELIEDLHRRHGTTHEDQSRRATDKELVQAMLHGSVNRLFEMRGSYTDLIRNEGGYSQDTASVVGKNNDRFAIAYLREIPTFSGEPKVIAQQITKISKDALCQFAASRPGILTDMTFQRNEKGRDNLTAKYFGHTPITINIPKIIPFEMKALIEPAYSEFREQMDSQYPETKPKGIQNNEVWEAQQLRSQQKKNRR